MSLIVEFNYVYVILVNVYIVVRAHIILYFDNYPKNLGFMIKSCYIISSTNSFHIDFWI